MTTQEQGEFSLASSVVDILTRTYPGFAWTAAVDAPNGIIKIVEPSFMDNTVPYVIRLIEVNHSEKALRKKLVDAGGEILERFYLPREAINHFQANDKIQLMPRDYTGKASFDQQGIKNWIGA
jgi:hypothetical protein